jgi:hypothetical protein
MREMVWVGSVKFKKELLLKMLANDQPDKNSESTQSVEIKLKHICFFFFSKSKMQIK